MIEVNNNCGLIICILISIFSIILFLNWYATYQTNKEKSFVTEGGIRERMTAARMGYRNQQKETIEELKKENARLKSQMAELVQTMKP